jgi:hypothetical protein
MAFSGALLVVAVAFCQSTQTPPFGPTPGPPPVFTSVPPIEDPELYFQFFQYHLGLVNINQAAKTANPAQAASLDQQMAALLNVDVKDLPAVIANTQKVAAAQASVAAKRAAGPNKSSPFTPTQQASALEFERVHTTVGGVRELWQSLSPPSWTGIHGYIVGSFKSQIYKKP